MREMWSVVTRWQHVGQDAVELPALGIFTCWMVSCKECTLFENKFDTNKDASNKCENERIFLNFLEFT